MNKYLVTLYVPLLQTKYDVLIPSSKRVIDFIDYSLKIIDKLVDQKFNVNNCELINRENGNIYKKEEIIINTDIKNGTELIII